MARLPRPHIPLSIRIEVATRQLRETAGHFRASTESIISSILSVMPTDAQRLAALLDILRERLAEKTLHLDHDPALGAREFVYIAGFHVGYRPDANDPRFLLYRGKTAHVVKTNIRGEHGQHPDRVLIKKNKKLEARRQRKPRYRRPKRRWGSRPFPKRK